MKNFRFLLTLFLILLSLPRALSVKADNPADTVLRPVLSTFMYEIGSASVNDTYLTPLTYKGWTMALSYRRLQAMRFNPEKWIMQLGARLSLSRALNPAHTSLMWAVDFNPRWDMMWRKKFPAGFSIAAGGNIDADIGVLYLPRNSNNPASAKASVTLGASAMAVWNGNIGHLPVTLSYQPVMPLVGAFFSPVYDELYYEIWLGNRRGLARCAWPGNFFRLDNSLFADLHFGATTLRLGYRCEVFSSKASDIVKRHISHSFVIGVATELISLRARASRTPDARIISALY